MSPSLPADRGSAIPAAEVPAAELHAAFSAAFGDYLAGPFQVPFAQWPAVLARHGVDLPSSRAWRAGGAITAFALVTPRPDIRRWRVAAMGAVPASRGNGAAPALLDDTIARATAAGVAALELECFAQNERALRLYRSRGMQPVRELAGYSREPEVDIEGDDGGPDAPWTGAADGVREVDRAPALARVDELSAGLPDLPFQLTARSLAAITRPLHCWQHGAGQVIFSRLAEGRLQVESLVDRGAAQDDALALARALARRHPGEGITLPALQVPELGAPAALRAGFRRDALHQLLMVRPLAADPPSGRSR